MLIKFLLMVNVMPTYDGARSNCNISVKIVKQTAVSIITENKKKHYIMRGSLKM